MVEENIPDIPGGSVAQNTPSSRYQLFNVRKWTGSTDALFGMHIRPGWIRHPRERVSEDWKDMLSAWFVRWFKFIFATLILVSVVFTVLIEFPTLALGVVAWGMVFVMIGFGEFITRRKDGDWLVINQIKGRRVIKEILPENYELNERAESVVDTRDTSKVLWIPRSLMSTDPADGGVAMWGLRSWPLDGGRNIFFGDYEDSDENKSGRVRTVIGSESDAFSNMAIIKTIAPQFWKVPPRFYKTMLKFHANVKDRPPHEVRELMDKMKLMNEQIRTLRDTALDIEDLTGHAPRDWIHLDDITFGKKYMIDHVVGIAKMNERWLTENLKFQGDSSRVIGDAVRLFENAEAVQRHLSKIYTAHGRIKAQGEIDSMSHYARMANIGSEPLNKYIQLMESKLDNASDNQVKTVQYALREENSKNPLAEDGND